MFLVLWLIAPACLAAAEVDRWRLVFDRPEVLSDSDAPVACVLNIQHPDIIRAQLANEGVENYSGKRFADRVKALSRIGCLHLHFTEVTGKDLDRPNVKAILIGGRSRAVSPDRAPLFFSLIRETQIPTIGFCGGMGIIGQAYSAQTGPMRKLRPGESDPYPGYHPGMFKEWGYLPVRITERDPLFESLPDEIVVREAHVAQMLKAPPQFTVLAATNECPVQSIKHRERLLYATQFHPEAYDDLHPQGRTVLYNFLKLAGIAAEPIGTSR